MSVLDHIGFSVDWSNPLADTVDKVIRQAIKESGLEEKLEAVSGDNERLREVAGYWRAAARDMRGVVDDLVAERRALQQTWAGDASTAFGGTMSEFEKSLLGEADDMDTVAELLESAAEACTMAENAMVELIVEVVEALLVAAATAAIVAVLTAGVGAAIGPLIAAAGVAHRAMKAVRITAKLADTLADLAKRMQALRKLAKARTKLRAVWRDKGTMLRPGKRKLLSKAINKGVVKPLVGAQLVGAAVDAAPTAASVAEHYGMDTQPIKDAAGNVADTVNRAGDKAEGVVRDVTGHEMDVPPVDNPLQSPQSKEQAEYANRPEPQRFGERLTESAPFAGKSVREVFG
ncbi:WXG100 family type VII secretion target [Streptomyces shaanxiensis]|uniref:WXG100 family type VII secretion target n=1 Tax=Streptomyces shaanxiensis TaxID=653357 RepID=A0ABP7VVD4_9ACTN